MIIRKEDIRMAGKLEITEFVEHIRRIKNPYNDKYFWNCLDVKVKGSENAPKGLPLPSKEIQYTILITDKQRNKIESDLLALEKDIHQCKLKIQGEITLDLPFGIIDGDIGVIAYQIKCIEEKVNTETTTISKKKLKLKDIVVPNKFLRTNPRENKIKSVIQYYNAQGEMPDPVTVIPLNDGTYYLQDGYIEYLASKAMGIEVWIRELIQNQACYKDGKLFWPLELLEIPNEYLDTIPRQEKVDMILKYIDANQITDKPIDTDLQPNGLRLLKNGYIRYLASKQRGCENIWIEE